MPLYNVKRSILKCFQTVDSFTRHGVKLLLIIRFALPIWFYNELPTDWTPLQHCQKLAKQCVVYSDRYSIFKQLSPLLNLLFKFGYSLGAVPSFLFSTYHKTNTVFFIFSFLFFLFCFCFLFPSILSKTQQNKNHWDHLNYQLPLIKP